MTTNHALEARQQFGAGALTARFHDALQFAFERHRFHFRKGSRVPYLSHLMSVSALVLEHGGSEDQATAALLHDAVEDAAPGQGPEVLVAIGQQFGEAVRAVVAACSDSLNEHEGGKAPWAERKQAYVAGLADESKKSDDALLVTAADKTHNALAIARDLRTFGPGFWGTFSACEHDLLWYYTAVTAAVSERLGDHTIVRALDQAVKELMAAGETVPVPEQPSTCGCPRRSRAQSGA